MIRVAIDGRHLRGTALRGWDRYTIELVHELPRHGVEPTLIFRAGQPLCADHVQACGAETLAVAAPKVSVWEQVALPLMLKRRKFDLYHAPAERGVPLLAPCPRVLTLHSASWYSYRHLVQQGKLPGKVGDYLPHAPRLSPGALYVNAQFRWADHVLVPSEFARQETVELMGLPTERVTATPLGLPRAFEVPPLDEAFTRAALNRLGISTPFVLYVGGFERHKNVEGLLDAAKEVLSRRPDVTFVLVGTGEVPNELRDRVVGLGEKFVFLTNVTDDLVAIYEGASVFASLSYRETFCLPALEALSRGVPIVASAWGATRDIVGDHGELVDPRDVQAAATAIVKTLESPTRSAASSALRESAREFSWSRCVSTTVNVYERLLSTGRRG